MKSRCLPLIVGFLLLTGCSRDPNIRKQKYLESGERYFAKAEYSAASIQFHNALQVDPQFAEAHYQLASTYMQLQDWNHAQSEFEETIQLEPRNDAARLDLANLLLAAAQLKLAREEIDILVAHQPNNPGVLLANGNLLAAEQNFSDAIQVFQKCISLDPGRADTYFYLALAQLKNNQADGPEINLQKAIQRDQKFIKARLALGSYYESKQRLAEAEQQYLQAIDLDRRDPAYRLVLAHLYVAEGRKAEAEDFLRQSKADFPDNSIGYRMLGDLYFAEGDLDKALSEYTQLRRDHSKDPVVAKNYVQLLILKKRLDEASSLDDGILKSEPGDVDALIERGQIQIAEGHPSEAVGTLQMALKNNPDSGMAYYHLGIAFDRLKNPRNAEVAWQEAVRRHPEMAEAHRALILAALHKGDMVELERRATRVIDLQPFSPDGYAMRALSRIRRGQFSQAEPDIQRSISVAPQSAVGYLQLGNLMLARKDYRQAQKSYQQALDRDDHSKDALSGLIDTYVALNDPTSAFNAARTQIAKVPDSSVFYDLLGTALFDHKRNLEDEAEAEASLSKAVQLDERNVDAWLKLIQLQVVHDSVDHAIATCHLAIQKNPDEAGIYVLLGELHNSKQQWNAAKEALQRALALDPENAVASHDLAWMMLQSGANPDLAMPFAEAARRGMPDSPQAADTMGFALYQKGSYALAIDQFEEALRLGQKANSPDNPTVHYHLGMAYDKAGRMDLARRHLKRVLTINPHYSRAEDVRRLLAQLQG